MSALDAVLRRTSWSKVTDDAPTSEQLDTLVAAAGRVADHSSLRPWRLIELRGDDRLLLGYALAKAAGDDKPSSKPLRAPLLIAVVASYRKSEKVPHWEQEAVASGVAHMLSLLLDEAGWGVIWRTGGLTRSEAVSKAHGLAANEELLGWLYVGGRPAGKTPGRRKPLDVGEVLSRMPEAAPETAHAAVEQVKPKKAKKDKKSKNDKKRKSKKG
ncbi:nitroreductase family protein [Microbacterium sp. H1-D42]|uniref:nitroreductase family protein n=1 Tax=Microbacterium sp. H1-D42 TaxID=2925844 RepID=UPI001F536756|nr:nitroreductase family protein [Microbacterium sp. H1-D42]UNK71792.1 nitroreductase family protein [Microbacterium sp. H1-D42]